MRHSRADRKPFSGVIVESAHTARQRGEQMRGKIQVRPGSGKAPLPHCSYPCPYSMSPADSSFILASSADHDGYLLAVVYRSIGESFQNKGLCNPEVHSVLSEEASSLLLLPHAIASPQRVQGSLRSTNHWSWITFPSIPS